MKRKIILTILGILITVLVISFALSYAYFAHVQSNTSFNVNVTTASRLSVTTSGFASLSLNVDENEMYKDNINNGFSSNYNDLAFYVNVPANSGSASYTCTYDVYYLYQGNLTNFTGLKISIDKNFSNSTLYPITVTQGMTETKLFSDSMNFTLSNSTEAYSYQTCYRISLLLMNNDTNQDQLYGAGPQTIKVYFKNIVCA